MGRIFSSGAYHLAGVHCAAGGQVLASHAFGKVLSPGCRVRAGDPSM